MSCEGKPRNTLSLKTPNSHNNDKRVNLFKTKVTKMNFELYIFTFSPKSIYFIEVFKQRIFFIFKNNINSKSWFYVSKNLDKYIKCESWKQFLVVSKIRIKPHKKSSKISRRLSLHPCIHWTYSLPSVEYKFLKKPPNNLMSRIMVLDAMSQIAASPLFSSSLFTHQCPMDHWITFLLSLSLSLSLSPLSLFFPPFSQN